MSQTPEIGTQAGDPIAASVVKLSSTWFLVILSKLGINGWSDMSAVLACIVSVLFIGDFFWKKYKLWKTGKE